MTKNKESTRYYSQKQENEVLEIIGGHRQSNSGAGLFNKGDVINKDIELLVECKCSMTDKESFSIKKDWLEKNKIEMRQMGLSNHCLAFNFGPSSDNYYIIDKKLMEFLIGKLYETYNGEID